MLQAAVLLFVIATGLSTLLVFVTRRQCLRIGFVAHPVADRYNKKIIPLGGGLAIFITLLAVLLPTALAGRFIDPEKLARLINPDLAIHLPGLVEKSTKLLIILLSITGLFTLGLYDDLKRLGPKSKLLLQFLFAALAVVFADLRIEFFIHNQIVTSILSLIWIVLIINAFNFLDNMDGLSAGIALITSTILMTVAAVHQQVFVTAFALTLIAALAGFLLFNFPPAKIFMGDAGSMVVGFCVALLTLRTTYYQQTESQAWYPVLMPLIIMAVPLYDFLSVTILRISQGKSPFVGDTQHFSHRIKRRGLSDTQTVLTLYLATLCTGLGAAFLYQVNLLGAILILIQTSFILAMIAIFETTGKNNVPTEQ